jgi:hypothetical protein
VSAPGDPPTEELQAIQAEREVVEREQAHEAETPAGERTHRRRADRAAYLQAKLAEQAESLEK